MRSNNQTTDQPQQHQQHHATSLYMDSALVHSRSTESQIDARRFNTSFTDEEKKLASATTVTPTKVTAGVAQTTAATPSTPSTTPSTPSTTSSSSPSFARREDHYDRMDFVQSHDQPWRTKDESSSIFRAASMTQHHVVVPPETPPRILRDNGQHHVTGNDHVDVSFDVGGADTSTQSSPQVVSIRHQYHAAEAPSAPAAGAPPAAAASAVVMEEAEEVDLERLRVIKRCDAFDQDDDDNDVGF